MVSDFLGLSTSGGNRKASFHSRELDCHHLQKIVSPIYLRRTWKSRYSFTVYYLSFFQFLARFSSIFFSVMAGICQSQRTRSVRLVEGPGEDDQRRISCRRIPRLGNNLHRNSACRKTPFKKSKVSASFPSDGIAIRCIRLVKMSTRFLPVQPSNNKKCFS